jgi:hypothetical protein
MQIDENDGQLTNARAPIHDSFEPDSKVTAKSDLQSAKHASPSVSIDRGRQIDESDEKSRNTPFSTRKRLEPNSKATVATRLDLTKEMRQRVWTDEGMKIERMNSFSKKEQESKPETFRT